MNQQHPTSPAPGWHTNAQGQQQWWDGTSWGPVAPQAAPAAPQKTRTAAYLLAIFLGGVGAHRFYLRRYSTAWLFVVLWVAQLFFFFNDARSVSTGIIVIVGLWLVIDLFRIPILVDNINGKPRPLY